MISPSSPSSRQARVFYNAFTAHDFPSAQSEGNTLVETTEIAAEYVPEGEYACYPAPHVKYYPVGSGASYLLKYAPHYEKMCFVCDFGDKWVVGWYYKRRLESTSYPRDSDWKHLYDQDTRINTNTLVLKARDDQGEFIRGKVWLACFGFPCPHPTACNPYTSVPKQIIHSGGWMVPSWALTPVATFIQPNLLVRQPHPMPVYEDLLPQAQLVLVKTPSPSRPSLQEENTRTESPPEVRVPAVRLQHLPVKPQKSKDRVILPAAYKFIR